MARTDTLGHFLTDIADSIREKKGISGAISVSDFDSEIEGIPSGADLSEYFTDSFYSATSQTSGLSRTIKRLPANSFNGTSCQNMFMGGSSLVELDLSNFDTSNVTQMSNMFNMCTSLTRLDLSSFDTSKVTQMSGMFSMCTKLQFLDIRNFTFDSLAWAGDSSMFYNVPASCEIIVKSQTQKDWVLERRTDFTNVKTVEEYEAEQNG